MKQLIEDLISALEYHVEQTRPIHSTTVAIQAAREALAKQEGQSNFCPQCEALARELKSANQGHGEPVPVIGSCFQLLYCRNDWSENLKVGDKLYTAPQQRKPLNEVKLKALYKRIIRSEDWSSPAFHSFSLGFRVAETEHGIKE